MTTEAAAAIDWAHWYERWERQQAGYLPGWEERFTAMLDALAVLLPELSQAAIDGRLDVLMAVSSPLPCLRTILG